jgi:response regulator NasT
MSKKYRIAVADDHLDSLACLRRFLESAGHEIVVEAHSGEELVKLCAHVQCDLILTDVKMTGMDGLEAVSIIRKSRETPVIVVSAFFDEDLLQRANSCGVFGYLTKPIRLKDLWTTIEIVVHRYNEFELVRLEAVDARHALDDRKDIERAKGILMKRCSLDESSAFRHLQQLARTHRKKLVDIAKSILLAYDAMEKPLVTSNTRKLATRE